MEGLRQETSAPLSMRPQEGQLATPTLNNGPSKKEPRGGGAVLTPHALLAFCLPPSLHALVSSVLHNGMLWNRKVFLPGCRVRKQESNLDAASICLAPNHCLFTQQMLRALPFWIYYSRPVFIPWGTSVHPPTPPAHFIAPPLFTFRSLAGYLLLGRAELEKLWSFKVALIESSSNFPLEMENLRPLADMICLFSGRNLSS